MVEARSRFSRRPGLLAVAGLSLGALVAPLPHARAGGGAACPARYTVAADQTTVTDNDTHLVWQRTVSGGSYTWQGAQDHCKTLPLAGAGWRLPHVFELQTLIDESRAEAPAIDVTAFPGTPEDSYWSSTPVATVPTQAWGVSFVVVPIAVGHNSVSAGYRARCVR